MARPKKSTTNNNNNNTVHRTKKKDTFTFTMDEGILNEIRNDSDHEGISVNAKINHILERYARSYMYGDERGSNIIMNSSMCTVLENIEEDKILEQYKLFIFDMVPNWLTINKLPLSLKSWVNDVCNGLLPYTGSIHRFSHDFDSDDRLNMTFLHDFGIKWSRIIGATYSKFIEDFLQYHTTSSISPGSAIIKIIERNQQDAIK